MSYQETPPEIFRCECYGDALVVDKIKWAGDEYPEITVAWWKHGDRDPNAPFEWRLRLREAWAWLRGRPTFASSVILRPERARQLGRHLLVITDE